MKNTPRAAAAFVVSAFFAFLILPCAGSAAQAAPLAEEERELSLMDAIEISGEKIAASLPKGSRAAIAAFTSPNAALSEYLMEELSGALFERGVEVADRRNLAYVYRELDFQMSGDVSDESAVSIGKFLGAGVVVTGTLTELRGAYRLRINAVNVETAALAGLTRLDVKGGGDTERVIAALANQTPAKVTAKYGVSEDRTPVTAGTYLDRGILFASKGNYPMAIADFGAALELEPALAAAYALRGRALYASVSEVYAVGGNFSTVAALITRGQVSAEDAAILEKAALDFTRAIELEPTDAFYYLERGTVYNKKEDYDRAIADYSEAIQLKPDSASAYSNRGGVYSAKGDHDRAIADLNEAIRLKPDYVPAYFNRGAVYHTKRDYDKAITDYNEAIRLDPDLAGTYTNRGNVYYARVTMTGPLPTITKRYGLTPILSRITTALPHITRNATMIGPLPTLTKRYGLIPILLRRMLIAETCITLAGVSMRRPLPIILWR